MKTKFLSCLIAVFICGAAYTKAHAVGLGAYFRGSVGEGSWLDSSGGSITTNSMTQIGGGLLLDTCVAGQGIFNYRLTLGYDNFSSEHGIPGDSGTISMNADRVSIYNTFGFGVVRTESLRFWLGPQLGIFYSSGSGSGMTNHYEIGSGLLFTNYSLTYEMFGASLGLALGLNFNFGEFLTLFVETGARYSFNYSMGGGSGVYTIMGFPFRATVGDLMVHGYEGYASAGVMFRINDIYSAQ